MTKFFYRFSGIGGFQVGLVHTLDLRQKAAHEASVAATETRKEATG